MRQIMLATALCAMALTGPAFAQPYASPDAPSGDAPSGDTPSGAPPGATHGGAFKAKFEAANTTHDGHLTLDQAKAAHMMAAVRHFDDIDADHKGYITVQDMHAYRQKMKAQQGSTPAQ